LKENQSELKLKAIKSDNGGEFIQKDLQNWLEGKGIKHEFSPARTPQCNGVVERANRSIIEMTRTMLADSKMPLDFWAKAACTAAHIKNRSKSTIHGKTPYKKWSSRKPNVGYLRRFGCIAYLLDKEERRNKFDTKIIKGIFVGYATNNTYRIYVPKTGKIKADCDVKFDENRNGRELLSIKEKEDREVEREELIIMGLEVEDEKGRKEEQEENEDNEEDGRIEDENSNYEDAVIEEIDVEETNNDNKDDMTEVEDIPVRPDEAKSKGRPKGITKSVMEVCKQLMQEKKRNNRKRRTLEDLRE